MCGIAGVLHYGVSAPVDAAIASDMTCALSHRGPDAEGLHLSSDGRVALGHRRLSIIDIGGGAQPMSHADERYWIVYNGEIYNFPELRRELEAKGRRFRTRSDTEVILQLFEAEGTDGIARLNGMFAFALWDSRERRLVLVRDHFGVKPLYYVDDGRRLLFASELKGLLQHPDVRPEVDLRALTAFLELRYNPAPDTLLRGIRKLRPGEMLIASAAGVQTKSFHVGIPEPDDAIRPAEAIERYLALFEQAVQRQMISDVPVGLLLSGGVDSALLGYFMTRHSGSVVDTFTVGFEGAGDFNELADARATATLLRTNHHEMVIHPDVYLTTLPETIWHTEEPVGEPTVAAYHEVCKMAHQHVKVALMGQGADEPLGGYNRYYPERYRAQVGWMARLPGAERIASSLPHGESLSHAVRALGPSDPLDRFMAVYTLFSDEQQRDLWQPECLAQLGADFGVAARRQIETLQRRVKHLPGLTQLLFLDARTSLPDDLLLFGDKLAMATSLETRVPFLDLDLVRFIESLPPDLKIRGGKRKWIHKQAAGRVLPAEILRRKKRGFRTPIADWLRGRERERFEDILLADDAGTRRFFRAEAIRRLFDQHARRQADHARRLFALLSLELWYQRVVRGEHVTI